MDPAVTSALIAELGKKTGVCWVVVDGATCPVWFVWFDDAVHLVSGGDEQPFPDVQDGTEAAVTMRSKDTGGRLVTWVGSLTRVRPDSAAWAPAVAALAAARISIPSLTETPRLWETTSTVWRITPTGAVLEAPDPLP